MSNMKIRGQAAVEFLITYGWAIMAAMIVIGALAYFGMTNPAASLPDKCTFSNGFDCKDYQINSTALKVMIINTGGETVYGTGPNSTINVSLTDNMQQCNITGGNPTLLDPDVQMEVVCNNVPGAPYNVKEKAKVKITIIYARNPTGYSQTALGEIYATVQ